MAGGLRVTIRKGFRASVLVYSATAISLLAGFFISVVLARGLAQEEFGVYRICVSIVLFGTFLTSLGLEPALSRFGAEILGQRQTHFLHRWLPRFLSLRIAGALVTGSVLFVYREQLAVALNLGAEHEWILGFSMALMVLLGMNGLWGTATLAARLEQGKDAVVQASGQLLLMTGYGVLLYAGYGLKEALMYWVVVQCLLLLSYSGINVRWAQRLVSDEMPATERSEDQTRRIFRYSLFQYLAMVAHFASDPAINTFFIASLLGIKDVAVFGVAVTLAMLVMRANPISLLRSVVQTMLVQRYVVTRSLLELEWSFTFLTKVAVVTTLPTNIAIVVFAEPLIVHVFGHDFAPGAQALMILAALTFVTGLSYPFTPLIAVLEKNEVYLGAGAVSLLNPVLCVLLIPTIGIVGAALAMGATGAIRYAYYVMVFRFRLRFSVRFPWGAFAKIGITTSVLAGFGYWVRDEVTTLPALLVVIACLGTGYIAAVFGLRIFDNREQDLMRVMVARAGISGSR